MRQHPLFLSREHLPIGTRRPISNTKPTSWRFTKSSVSLPTKTFKFLVNLLSVLSPRLGILEQHIGFSGHLEISHLMSLYSIVHDCVLISINVTMSPRHSRPPHIVNHWAWRYVEEGYKDSQLSRQYGTAAGYL